MEKTTSGIYQKPRVLSSVLGRAKSSRQYIQEALDYAGITINGGRPHDIIVHNNDLYDRVIREGSIGVGESYMDGWWDCHALDAFFNRIFRTELKKYFEGNWKFYLHALNARLLNLQKGKRSYEVGLRHYDAGNAFYRDMLDDRMTYTCGYWAGAQNLNEAQEAKLDLICRKMELSPGMSVLDIGCGWGSFAGYAAEKYGANVTGITISQEQADLARALCSGLPVDITLQDYRDITGQYDRVLSVGMLEHVGYKNYRTYMETTARCLKDDGIALIQAIGGNASATTTDPWLDKYIFPNSMLPSISQIGRAMEGLFVMEDWHNFGPDYDKTLMAWHENFENCWQKHKEQYGERFYRMWKFYLLSCAGVFRSRHTNLWQIVMTKKGCARPACRLA
ncbi:MAG: cyclopropane fatty acyl phospholipid synthase [Desulfobacterales bacterium]|nr:cyclopropane fatty acyl phospholipid synthase [Desulfobacterales bacterium]